MRAKRSYSVVPAGFIAASVLAGCNAILGLNELSIDNKRADGSTGGSGGSGGSPMMDAAPDGFVGECTTNAECTARLTDEAADAGTLPEAGDGGARVVPAICLKPEQRCVQLTSDDCNTVTGDFQNDDAIILGTLFSTVGAQGKMNLQRQQSATLAAEQINAVGGIPAPSSGGNRRPLVMVSCNEATPAGSTTPILPRAGAHLIQDLRVPAIVGPNTSQDTIELSNTMSVAAGTVLLTPSAVASSVAELMDEDLTWLMVPSDRQRGELMIDQINLLEMQLRETRQRQLIKLGIVWRNDAVGQGTRSSLNDLILNGKPLNDPINAPPPNGNVSIDGYDFLSSNQDALVSRYLTFQPDIIVLAGLAEVINTVMNPLEEKWPTSDAGENRPYYVLTDQTKGPDVLISAGKFPGLRARVRGTGITPLGDSKTVHTAFELDYRARYGDPPTASGAGPSYDATYALAFALAAMRDFPVTGPNIAKGLRKLAGGQGASVINVGQSNILTAFSRLGGGDEIRAIGTFVPFEWDERGAVVNGTIEVWCVGAPANEPAYLSAGRTYDIKTRNLMGMYTPCD